MQCPDAAKSGGNISCIVLAYWDSGGFHSFSTQATPQKYTNFFPRGNAAIERRYEENLPCVIIASKRFGSPIA